MLKLALTFPTALHSLYLCLSILMPPYPNGLEAHHVLCLLLDGLSFGRLLPGL